MKSALAKRSLSKLTYLVCIQDDFYWINQCNGSYLFSDLLNIKSRLLGCPQREALDNFMYM